MLITTKPHVRLDAFRFLVCGHRLSLSLTFIIVGGGVVSMSDRLRQRKVSQIPLPNLSRCVGVYDWEKLHLLTGRNDLAQEIVRSK